MIRKLLARFGYVPAELVDQAYYEGKVHGQDDVTEMYRQRLEGIEANYADIERHRNQLMKVLADYAALQMPKSIIVKRPANG